MGLSIVLLAAGQGKRMKTAKPKPLVELADKPLIQYSLDTAMKLNPERTVLVTGYKKDEVKKYKGFGGIRIEDNVHITDSGHEILGPNIPKTISEIESCMAGSA